MFDQRRSSFHLARADAERSAADRAACAMTRTLHLELAALHDERARSMQQPDAIAVIESVWRHQGAPVRSSPIERTDASHA